MMSPLYQYDLAKGIYENYPEIPDKEYVVAALDKVEDSSGIDVFYEILTEVYSMSEEAYKSVCVSMMYMVESANKQMVFCKEDIISFVNKTLEPYPDLRDDVVPSLKVFLGDRDFREFFHEMVMTNFEQLYHAVLEERAKKEIHGE